MKGILLAGGTGSRLGALVRSGVNKHLLPVGREPMIFHPLKKLVKAGVTEILIVTGTEHMGTVVNALGSGSDFGAEFTYRVQDKPGGIAQALGLAENFVHGDKMVVILGDNVFQDDITGPVAAFAKQAKGARVLLKEVEDPQRFGVAELQGDRIAGIEEKPKRPKSKLCVTGIYMFDARVFEIIKTLKPSGRGELEITDVNNAYIESGELAYDVLKGWWTDAGTFESLARANELVAKG
jgi:glucose-1-phosphate thymidylyltransferase